MVRWGGYWTHWVGKENFFFFFHPFSQTIFSGYLALKHVMQSGWSSMSELAHSRGLCAACWLAVLVTTTETLWVLQPSWNGRDRSRILDVIDKSIWGEMSWVDLWWIGKIGVFFFLLFFLFLVCFLFSLFLSPNFFVHGYSHSVSFSLLLQPRLSHMFYLIASVEFPSILHRHMAWLAGLFLFLFSIALVECCCFSSSGYSFTFVRSCRYGSYTGQR